MKYIASILFLCFAAAANAQTAAGTSAIQQYLDGISYWRFQYNAEDTSFGHEVSAQDSIYAMNDSLMHYLVNVAPSQPGFLKRKPMLAENADIKIVTTEDKKLAVYCWNSHAGTLDFYNAVALYETAGGVKSHKLADASERKGLEKVSGEFYDVLSVTHDNGDRYYIFQARVKMSEKEVLNIMTAYTVADNQLKAYELFEGGASSGRFVTYIYDYMANYDFEKMKEVHTVHLSKNGKKLYIPDVTDGQLNGKMQVYNFNGSKFVYDKTE
ncbi:MAG: hypothetical protein H3C54_12100 [Taibaiella sp.]|nr:hypothetical protein [Taibaiella sp.]